MRDISLLRGINVGGHNMVSMPTLRAIYASLGCTDVTTYVQSGNVVYRDDRDPADLAAAVEVAIATELGLQIRVLGLAGGDLARIVAVDPFPTADPGRLVVVFLSGDPGTDAGPLLEAAAPGDEEAVIGEREIFIHYPGGMGRSKLTHTLIERRLGLTATARNWRTVTKLLELSRHIA